MQLDSLGSGAVTNSPTCKSEVLYTSGGTYCYHSTTEGKLVKVRTLGKCKDKVRLSKGRQEVVRMEMRVVLVSEHKATVWQRRWCCCRSRCYGDEGEEVRVNRKECVGERGACD